MKKIVASVFVLSLLLVLGVQVVTADNPDWKEDQDALFRELDVEPGEIITRDQIDKAKKVLPGERMGIWFERGDIMPLQIEAYQYDSDHDDYWKKETESNLGRYAIDSESGEIIEKESGEFPVFVNGQPFPESEITLDDPTSGSKVMYNKFLCKSRTETFRYDHHVLWISFNGGLERTVGCYWATYFYWGRKGGPVNNPEKLVERDLTIAVSPFDMAGTAQLTLRKLGTKCDQVYAYVPAIRRVKRLSGSNRSDPYMGSEAVVDDGFGFIGLESSMEWTYKGRKTALCEMMPYALEHTTVMDHNSDGSWSCSPPSLILGFEKPEAGCAKWATTNCVWVPRVYHVVEAMPKDPYYSCGKMEFWIDAQSYLITCKWVYDKAGDYWKGLQLHPIHLTWGDNHGIQTVVAHTICDEKIGHATVVKGGCGKVNGSAFMKTTFNMRKITPRMLTVENMKMLTK